MNSLSLAIAAIRFRPLQASLCVIAAASGVALLCAVFLFSQAINGGLMRNAQGIDIVAGAKGSPVQLVLSTIYHADVPIGNIDMKDYEALKHIPAVKQLIPLAIGDNYKGWRVVGTTPDYLSLYHTHIREGHIFSQDFEAVAGAATSLKLGTQFAALHGFAANSDDVHNFHLYTITGILKPTGTVIDRLIVTSYQSVQQLHAHPDAGDPDAAEELPLGHQITAVFIKAKSPIAIMNLPREINRSTNIVAASPSYEMTRVLKSFGLGKDILMIVGSGILLLSSFMLLSSLASNLTARRYDLAVLRVLGASSFKISLTVIAEGLILSGLGTVAGLTTGHLLCYFCALLIKSFQGFIVSADFLLIGPWDFIFLGLGLSAGLLASLIPAFMAARADIAFLLTKGRA